MRYWKSHKKFLDHTAKCKKRLHTESNYKIFWKKIKITGTVKNISGCQSFRGGEVGIIEHKEVIKQLNYYTIL